jgi:hypothetical protein
MVLFDGGVGRRGRGRVGSGVEALSCPHRAGGRESLDGDRAGHQQFRHALGLPQLALSCFEALTGIGQGLAVDGVIPVLKLRHVPAEALKERIDVGMRGSEAFIGVVVTKHGWPSLVTSRAG